VIDLLEDNGFKVVPGKFVENLIPREFRCQKEEV
jgi:hypothetical protein